MFYSGVTLWGETQGFHSGEPGTWIRTVTLMWGTLRGYNPGLYSGVTLWGETQGLHSVEPGTWIRTVTPMGGTL